MRDNGECIVILCILVTSHASHRIAAELHLGRKSVERGMRLNGRKGNGQTDGTAFHMHTYLDGCLNVEVEGLM